MTGFVALVLGGLLAGLWFTAGLPRRGTRLAERSSDAVDLSDVSVIVPVRDEVANLPGLVAAVRAAGPVGELIVVDDASSDGSAELARSLGATVLEAGTPPAGWLGKPHACQVGANAATGRILVFLDADVQVQPTGLRDLVALHADVPDGLLSVQPFHLVERVDEHASAIPNVVSMMASGAFTARSDGASSLAFGPCLVLAAETYAAIGGHQAVRGSIIEDVALARVVAATGRPVRCRAGAGGIAFRMYPTGFRSLVEGWTKNLASGATSAPFVPGLAATVWLASLYAVTVELADPSPTLAVTYAALAAHLGWVLRRIGTFRPWVAVLFPLPLAAFTWFFVRSILARVRGVAMWRGRAVDLAPSRRR